jgi:hypothetical protein
VVTHLDVCDVDSPAKLSLQFIEQRTQQVCAVHPRQRVSVTRLELAGVQRVEARTALVECSDAAQGNRYESERVDSAQRLERALRCRIDSVGDDIRDQN